MDTSSEFPTSPGGEENPYVAPSAYADEALLPAAVHEGEPLNPWLSIWVRPRATIRQIVETDPTRHVLLLAATAGVFDTLDRASRREVGDVMPLIGVLAIALVGGPIFGVVGLYIGAAVLRWVGARLGGMATSEEVRAAMAWAGVPSIAAGFLWIPLLALFGLEMFTEDSPTVQSSPALLVVLLSIVMVQAVAMIWGFVVFLKCLGEVHRFSAWRALACVLLILVVLVGAVIVLFAMLLLTAVSVPG